jgi:hypothetical protein
VLQPELDIGVEAGIWEAPGAAPWRVKSVGELGARPGSNVAIDEDPWRRRCMASANPLPASLFRLLLLSPRTALDISIARHFIESTKRLAVKGEVFVVDGEACGGTPVAGGLVSHGICGGGRAGARGVCFLILGAHIGARLRIFLGDVLRDLNFWVWMWMNAGEEVRMGCIYMLL